MVMTDRRRYYRCQSTVPHILSLSKLSFSLPSKQSGKPTQKPSENFNDGDERDDTGITKLDYVTEFDASKALTDKSEKLIIPPKQNEWRPTKKMKNLDLPFQYSTAADPDIRFELEAPSTVGIPDSGMSYGLNFRLNKEGDAGAVDNGVGDKADNDAVEAPARPVSSENLILQKLRRI
uniref:Uncharacterized protein n=1 Tax=Nelumbo nucifera TaxID=4432 RepID=A0A822YVM3_NELNU|nr:TPA_asm: hypothetical protein HUJ06_005795 [Nelumbo nucifera]